MHVLINRLAIFLSILWALFVFFLFGAFRLFSEPAQLATYGWMILIWFIPSTVAWALLRCLAWVFQPKQDAS
jgi:hypothetical protein